MSQTDEVFIKFLVNINNELENIFGIVYFLGEEMSL